MGKNYARGIGERLRQIRGNLSQDEFADKHGVTRDRISDYENERSQPDLRFLASVAGHERISLNWLLTGVGEKTFEESFQKAFESIAVPRGKKTVAEEFAKYGIRRSEFRIEATVPAGQSHFTDRTDSVEVESLAEFNADEHVFIEISSKMGDSMRPVLRPGDLVLISVKDKIHDGDLVAAQWGAGEGAVKLYYDLGDKIQLSSINLAIEPIKLPKKMVKLYKVVLIKKKS